MFVEVVVNLLVEKNIFFVIPSHIQEKKGIRVTYVVKHLVEKIIFINIVKFTELLVLTNVNYVVFTVFLFCYLFKVITHSLFLIFPFAAGKSFIVQHYFLMHQANHGSGDNDELPYQCDICKKGFVKEEFLNRHKVRHRVRNLPQVVH